jgi:hypothetical protein
MAVPARLTTTIRNGGTVETAAGPTSPATTLTDARGAAPFALVGLDRRGRHRLCRPAARGIRVVRAPPPGFATMMACGRRPLLRMMTDCWQVARVVARNSHYLCSVLCITGGVLPKGGVCRGGR